MSEFEYNGAAHSWAVEMDKIEVNYIDIYNALKIFDFIDWISYSFISVIQANTILYLQSNNEIVVDSPVIIETDPGKSVTIHTFYWFLISQPMLWHYIYMSLFHCKVQYSTFYYRITEDIGHVHWQDDVSVLSVDTLPHTTIPFLSDDYSPDYVNVSSTLDHSYTNR